MVFFFVNVNCRLVCKLDALGREILGIAIPAVLTLAADPVASLIDTMFIGRLGLLLYSSTFIYCGYFVALAIRSSFIDGQFGLTISKCVIVLK